MTTMRKTSIAVVVAAMLAFGGINSAAMSSAAGEPSHVSGQILVKFSEERAADGVLRGHGLSQGTEIGGTGAHLIKVPAGKELQLTEALGRNPAVEYAEPDNVAGPATSDTFFGRQYALQNTGQSFTNNTQPVITVPPRHPGRRC
jgi:thermitase